MKASRTHAKVLCQSSGQIKLHRRGENLLGGFLSVKRGIDRVDIFLIHFLKREAQSLAETLIVYDLPLAQETDDIVHIRIVAQAENIIIGHARLLLRSQVFIEVGDDITLDRHACRAPRETRGSRGVYSGSAIDKIGVKPGLLDLLNAHLSRKLVDDSAYHLKMAKLLCAYRSLRNVPFPKIARTAAIYGLLDGWIYDGGQACTVRGK